MSKILLEADFETVDLRQFFNNQTTANSTGPAAETPEAPKDGSQSQTAELEAGLKEHGIPDDVIKKLMQLGDPFKKALKVLGYKASDPKANKNPILAFVKQTTVQDTLIKPGFLNISTFRAIYNAIAKNLVADSEFFAQNSYNLIYCKELYRKPVKEIEAYLMLQGSEILKPSASNYNSTDQLLNRKVFLEISGIEEQNITKRARLINDPNSNYTIPTMQDAVKLNSLQLARQILGQTTGLTTNGKHINTTELDKVVEKLTDIASKFAAILAISTNSNSKAARQALSNPKFSELNQKQIANAFIRLSTENILPKGQLAEETANALVEKILATFVK